MAVAAQRAPQQRLHVQEQHTIAGPEVVKNATSSLSILPASPLPTLKPVITRTCTAVPSIKLEGGLPGEDDKGSWKSTSTAAPTPRGGDSIASTDGRRASACGASGLRSRGGASSNHSRPASGASRARRRFRRLSQREDGSSRGSTETLSMSSVSTVTRGVSLQWKPRLNVDLEKFVYPSLMLEGASSPEAEGVSGDQRRSRPIKSGSVSPKLGKQPSGGRKRSLAPAAPDGGAPDWNRSRVLPRLRSGGSVRMARLANGEAEDSTTLPPLTWVLGVESEQSVGLETSSAGGGVTIRQVQELPGGVAVSSFSLQTEPMGDLAGAGRGSSAELGHRRLSALDDAASVSSFCSRSTFDDCLREGEEILRKEVRRLYAEQQQAAANANDEASGSGALAAKAVNFMATKQTRSIAATLSTNHRASTVQMRDELKRAEKEKIDEDERRLAQEQEEWLLSEKEFGPGNAHMALVDRKLRAKNFYFSQFQRSARTRHGGHFDTAAPWKRERWSDALASYSTSAAGKLSLPGIPVQVPEGPRKHAMSRDVFIVACLELGLHPDLSAVRWDSRRVDLDHFGLGDKPAGALAASLRHSPPEALTMRDNRMTDAPIGVVISSLDGESLMKLDLSENKVGPVAMQSLCAFLQEYACLEVLVLSATCIGDAEVLPLCNALLNNDCLVTLDLSHNALRSAGASSLARMLKSPSCGLKKLDISWNCCSGKGTLELGEALRRQASLEELELAFNSFSDDGTMALAMALLENDQLHTLGLSWNRVGGRASLALSRMLRSNTRLCKLDLSGNALSEDGGRSIIRSLVDGSTCEVAMRGCSFLEGGDILFDRSYPPPLITLDLDLKSPYEACLLHELVGLAQVRPGSKFLEVYRHNGGGRGRVSLGLQVEEISGEQRRAAVVDTATGKPWVEPDAGHLSVKFKVSRELPSSKDCLTTEAAWTAMMLLMEQETDTERINILRLVLRDTYVTTEMAQRMINQLSCIGIHPRDLVEMVWSRVLDVGNLYKFLADNVEYSARRDVVNILTHERFKFNWDNPTGHYRLELTKKSHREIMMLLSMVHGSEIQQGKRENRGDTSQLQNWSNFRNSTMNKVPVELTEASTMNLPVDGVLEFDYVSTAKAPPDSSHATDAEVQALQETLRILPGRAGGEKPNSLLAVLQLQQAAARYYFTTLQVIRIVDCFQHTKLQASAVAALFGRTWDLENFDAVLATLPDGVDKEAASRLGYLNVLNPLKIARHYELNIQHQDERKLLKLILDTSPQEKGDNLMEDHTSDLQIIDLYAGLGRLVDENKPLAVRLWYCDIGRRGNVPNWAVREKLLDKFLVGGKPVPDRVFEIVRMYKRMAEAGFLAREPGMGAADIEKANERFLRHSQDVKRGFGLGGEYKASSINRVRRSIAIARGGRMGGAVAELTAAYTASLPPVPDT